ncbi:MAG: hypothetical protein ABFR90_02365 [Planctomycetota bacterium]
MRTQRINRACANGNTQLDTVYRDLELAQADALLDQVDTTQQQIRDIQNDISLLETMENALNLISENMAQVRRLARKAQQARATAGDKTIASDEIRNLMMVNMLITEDTEFDDHLLFKDDIISMHSFTDGDLMLTTTQIPEVFGVETGDFQAMLDSLDSAARVINRQYRRIGEIMRILLDAYQQLRWEIDLLIADRIRRHWTN